MGTVDLSDLALFASEAKAPAIFNVCMSYAKFVPLSPEKRGGRCLRLLMTAQNWSRARSAGVSEPRALDVIHMVRQVAKRQTDLHSDIFVLSRHLQCLSG